tara:strand:- start:664 stop:831 length:168 start_codon:yes stop_codon:yes gene_type:complete
MAKKLKKIKKIKKPIINELIFECYLDAMIKTLRSGKDASKIFNRLNGMIIEKNKS